MDRIITVAVYAVFTFGFSAVKVCTSFVIRKRNPRNKLKKKKDLESLGVGDLPPAHLVVFS